MQKLEEFMNSLTDRDWGWWPVVSLRPPKTKEIQNFRLLKMTAVFGPVTALLIFLIQRRTPQIVSVRAIVLHLVLGCALFFVLYKFTFAYFWNRRARRLRTGAAAHNETRV